MIYLGINENDDSRIKILQAQTRKYLKLKNDIKNIILDLI